jgi:hypothetical protein
MRKEARVQTTAPYKPERCVLSAKRSASANDRALYAGTMYVKRKERDCKQPPTMNETIFRTYYV